MKQALSRRIGPFTVGVWLLIVAAGLALGLIARRFMDGLDSPADGDLEAGPIERSVVWASDAFATQGAIVPMNGGTAYGGSAGSGDLTNDQWARDAIRHLVNHGVDPVLADKAIRKYVQGDELTAEEAQIVGRAITEVGVPPRSLPAMKVAAQPATVPPAPSPTAPDRQWSAKELAWFDQLEADFNWLEAYDRGQVKGDPARVFQRLYGMGIRSNTPRLSTANKHRFRAWMRANRKPDADGKVP